MDAATLRLILIVVGATFLVGMYLWERRRAEDRDQDHGREHDWDNYLGDKREPNLGPLDSDSDHAGAESELERGRAAFSDSGWDDVEQVFDPARAEGSVDERVSDFADDDAPGEFDDATPAAPGEASTAATRDRTDQSAPNPDKLLIQLLVVSDEEPLVGERILAAAERVKLVPGSMDIFHRQATDDVLRAPLFSMANLVKPGTFPFDAMDEFETPGVALFAQFDGDPSDLMVYDELLHAARVLAEELDGDVQEPGRKTLTVDRAGILRGQVAALLRRRPGYDDVE
ncbi:MAG: cell division protein ZipA C-terminal FtsZ-binding domain-containing protein [Thiohalocapsa sp.]